MRTLLLFWKLLRYRVAVMLLLFLLVGAAINKSLTTHPWLLLIAALSLAFSYVSATSSNDIADQKIDAINHPKSVGRPLITGRASNKDMWIMFGLASLVSVLLAGLINLNAIIIISISILINVVYSLPPFRLSYRTFFAPLILGVAYVGVPYILAIAATHSKVTRQDYMWLIGLYLIFIGRILLKDFRDRKGDSKYSKPTFLLRFGKTATCILSSLLITAGGIVIVLQLLNKAWLVLIVAAYLLAILFMIKRLYGSPVGQEEQISIGVGAKMGNGLLITLLCAFALAETNTPASSQVIICMVVVILFFAGYFTFLKNPEAATIGYRG